MTCSRVSPCLLPMTTGRDSSRLLQPPVQEEAGIESVWMDEYLYIKQKMIYKSVLPRCNEGKSSVSIYLRQLTYLTSAAGTYAG